MRNSASVHALEIIGYGASVHSPDAFGKSQPSLIVVLVLITPFYLLGRFGLEILNDPNEVL